MPDFAKAIAAQRDLSVEEQKKAGTPIAGTLAEEHRDFLKTVTSLIDAGEIQPDSPQTFLKTDVYDGLDEEWKAKVDVALLNIANLVRKIDEYHRSKQTPDEAPQYATMIEDLWQMKRRIEEHHDVFKF
jgi:hypothetical protein